VVVWVSLGTHAYEGSDHHGVSQMNWWKVRIGHPRFWDSEFGQICVFLKEWNALGIEDTAKTHFVTRSKASR